VPVKFKNYTLIIKELFFSFKIKIYRNFPISLLPSRYIYGNLAGFFNNLLPKIELAFYKLISSKKNMSGELNHADAKVLHSQGYLLIPNQYSQDFINQIAMKYKELIEDRRYYLKIPSGVQRFIYEPLEKIPEMKNLITDEIADIIRHYYSRSFRVSTVRVWRNYHVPHNNPEKDVGYSNTFHHDMMPCTGLRLLVLLKDGVTRKTGAFRFHDKQTSKKLVRSFGFYSRWKQSEKVIKRLIDSSRLKYFEGNLGDACLVNTQECLHAASIPIIKSYRDIVQFEIYPNSVSFSNNKSVFSDMPPDHQINPEKLFYENKLVAS